MRNVYEQDYQYGMEIITAFKTSTSLMKIRQSINDNVLNIVRVDNDMRVISNTDNGITWTFGEIPGMGDGLSVMLTYGEINDEICAMFDIIAVYAENGIAPFIDRIRELRNQVIAAFEAADSDVRIITDIDEIDNISDRMPFI